MTKFHGTGPGVQTDDGCSVDLYVRLPYGGELSQAIACISPGSSVLELGCGAGRGTRALIEAGLLVTVVDSSREMLAHCPTEATLVHSDISSLELSDRFDAVILPTGLVNHVDADVREAFVQCAARHLKNSGRFFVQRQDPHWLATAVPSAGGPIGDITVAVQSVERNGKTVSMTLRYWTDNEVWTQSFVLLQLEEEDLEELLLGAGLGRIQWLDEKKTWLSAQSVAAEA